MSTVTKNKSSMATEPVGLRSRHAWSGTARQMGVSAAAASPPLRGWWWRRRARRRAQTDSTVVLKPPARQHRRNQGSPRHHGLGPQGIKGPRRGCPEAGQGERSEGRTETSKKSSRPLAPRSS